MLKMPNINHPFFAYGTFKSGQIAHSRIENHVKSISPAECKHKLFLRDGIPFISEHSREDYRTCGCLIKFKNNCKWDAYATISDVASDKLYYWKVIEVQGQPANALIGRKPSKSNPIRIGNEFDGKEDPYFKEAIEVIYEGIAEYEEDLMQSQDESEMFKSYFRLLRNYILLWASIERYLSLRYGDYDAKEKFARDAIFQESLKRHVCETRDIFRTDSLNRITLDANCPEDSIDYYYTVRCNIVHRGKTPYPNDRIVFESLKELSCIFKDVLDETFKK